MHLYNSRFKLCGRGKLDSAVFPAKAVEIMDVKGSHFMVTLKFLLEQDQAPIHYIDAMRLAHV